MSERFYRVLYSPHHYDGYRSRNYRSTRGWVPPVWIKIYEHATPSEQEHDLP